MRDGGRWGRKDSGLDGGRGSRRGWRGRRRALQGKQSLTQRQLIKLLRGRARARRLGTGRIRSPGGQRARERRAHRPGGGQLLERLGARHRGIRRTRGESAPKDSRSRKGDIRADVDVSKACEQAPSVRTTGEDL